MPPTSSGVTSHGPIGVACSQVLPWSHSSVRFCQSRIEMSLATVKPAIAAAASFARRVADAGADDQGELDFPVDLVATLAGSTMSSCAPISASGNFANSVGWVGELVTHLEDVVG